MDAVPSRDEADDAPLRTIEFRPYPCEDGDGIEAALAHLWRCSQAGEAVPSGGRNEVIDWRIESERKALLAWVAGQARHFVGVRLLDNGGSEHEVYVRSDDPSRVIKVTRPQTFGDYYEVLNGRMHEFRSSPGDYLLRLRLVELHFGFDQKFLGFLPTGQILTESPFVIGSKPDQGVVNRYLTELGFSAVKSEYWLWKYASERDFSLEREIFETWLGDVRSDNFVVHQGQLVPIDVRMWAKVRLTEETL